ncbi:MAG TPA: hypothetical protein VFH29_04040 [Anaerolineales bacterium]|nr:hypothetical protein [Anaerolineales bacterium]
MNKVRNWWESLFRPDRISSLPAAEGVSAPEGLADNRDEPASITTPRVLLIIINPSMDASSGLKLSTEMGWGRPDDLVRRFIAELLQASGGLVRYHIAERVELDVFPKLADGFQYDAGAFRSVMAGATPVHSPSGIDYVGLLEKYNVLRRVESGQLDEVWVMGFPHAGLYESVMAGKGAFWCNAPPLLQTARCPRRFVIMGFSYERDLGEMLHSYNHRAEAILARVFNSLGFLAWAYKTNRLPATIRPDQKLNLFERFILFDAIAPGKAGMGTVHYAPNAVRDYDLGSPRRVLSACYDWLRFPDFQGDVRMISAADWGGGSELAFQSWWMRQLPKTAGRTDGVHNNWWQYIANLDNVTD